MRLLDTETSRFVEFSNPREVKYAILSHTWDPNGEQTFQQVVQIQSDSSPGESILHKLSPKVRDFCERARANGYKYGWVDSCCIDKTSSAELSEAINSMYAWYRDADVCYAYLHDVSDSSELWVPEFRASRWHRRGWTLQELIAPKDVTLLSREWSVLGSKAELASLLEDITGVDRAVFTFDITLSHVSVAHRMSWAASRETTREEDRAYSLFGIFDVQLPILYGEGIGKAFFRLQEEIVRQGGDQSIFAWHCHGRTLPTTNTLKFPPRFRRLPKPSNTESGPSGAVFLATREHRLLASSPDDFKGSRDLVSLSDAAFKQRLGRVLESDTSVDCSAYGLHGRIPVVPVVPSGLNRVTHLVLLACEDPSRGLVGLLLRKSSGPSVDSFLLGASLSVSSGADVHPCDEEYARAIFITKDQIVALRSSVTLIGLHNNWKAARFLLVVVIISDIVFFVVLKLFASPPRSFSQPYIITSIVVGVAGVLVSTWLLDSVKDLSAYRNKSDAEHTTFFLLRQLPATSLVVVTVLLMYLINVLDHSPAVTIGFSPVLFLLGVLASLFISLRRGRVRYDITAPEV